MLRRDQELPIAHDLLFAFIGFEPDVEAQAATSMCVLEYQGAPVCSPKELVFGDSSLPTV
jgi:hypothetical protein